MKQMVKCGIQTKRETRILRFIGLLVVMATVLVIIASTDTEVHPGTRCSAGKIFTIPY